MKQSINEKAIQLIEDGIVDVDGHSVKVKRTWAYCDACMYCTMDCLFYSGSEMEDDKL